MPGRAAAPPRDALSAARVAQGFTIPLLIGGATTSKMHTAVKVCPQYSGCSTHVLDASRAVGVCAALLDPKKRAEFAEDVKEQYAELREDHYAGLASRKFKTLEAARKAMLAVDWKSSAPPVPKSLGNKARARDPAEMVAARRERARARAYNSAAPRPHPGRISAQVYNNFPLEELIPYIDWNPFFQVWQLRGKYPNRGYPKIFNDETVGEEAKKLHADAVAMLKEVVARKTLVAKGVAGIFPASAVGDDIEVFASDKSGARLGTFHTLRQQEEREDTTYLALSDFVAPKGSGVADYVGAFAVSCGFGCEKVCAQYRAQSDDYKGIMMEAIADRLAEAFAELIHEKMRKEQWGYAPAEALSVDELLKTKYQGIRPAPGYPTQPDHTEKEFMWKLLDAEKLTGISLTDSLAMLPAASVSALVFANPCSTYFQVGKICKDQIADYAARKGMSVDAAERWLGPYLAYDPAA